MTESLGISLIAAAIVAPAASLLAWMLWMARIPGDGPAGAPRRVPGPSSAIVAGIIAGALLGPAALSRVAPDWHRAVFLGGVEEHEALRLLEAEHRAARAALLSTGVSGVALDELRDQQREGRESVVAPLRAAERRHAGAIAWIAGLPIVLALGVALGVGQPSASRAERRRTEPAPAWLPGLASAACLPLALAALVAGVAWLFTSHWAAAILFASGMCALGLPPRRSMAPRSRPALAAAIVANALAGPAVWIIGFAGVLGRGVARLVPGAGAHRATRARAAATGLAFGVLLPCLIALSIVGIDGSALLADRSFGWLALLAFVLGADGRWLVLALVRRDAAAARGLAWTAAADQVDRGTAPLQATAAAAIALLTPVLGLPQGHTVSAALLIGSATIALGSPLRRSLARAMHDSSRR